MQPLCDMHNKQFVYTHTCAFHCLCHCHVLVINFETKLYVPVCIPLTKVIIGKYIYIFGEMTINFHSPMYGIPVHSQHDSERS